MRGREREGRENEQEKQIEGYKTMMESVKDTEEGRILSMALLGRITLGENQAFVLG